MSSTKITKTALALGLKLGLSMSLMATVPLAAAADLLDSARSGDTQAALEMISSGADVNMAEANGTTVLHWAVHNGDLELVRQLLRAEANVDVKNDYNASPVSEAALLGDADIMRALLEAGADPEATGADGQTALMIVARSNNLETARLLLEFGADVNRTEQWQGQSATLFAAAQSQPDMLKLLLDAGGDPNIRSIPNERDRMVSAERRFQWRPAGGLTALIYAAREGCLECTRLLIEAGADIDKGDAENHTPLLAAIINMHFDTAKYLVEADANVNKWTLRGENPIYAAVDVNTLPHGGYPDRPSLDKTSGLEMIEILLEAGANPNLQLKLQPIYRHLKDDRGADSMLGIGATPLLRAAKGHDVEAIRLLMAYGAHPNLPNARGTTPAMAAAGLGASSIDTRGDYTSPDVGEKARRTLEVLAAHGADIFATDPSGRTPLHGAVSWGWNEAVVYLINQGADPLQEDFRGTTALDMALGTTGSGRGGGTDPQPETAALIRELVPAIPQ